MDRRHLEDGQVDRATLLKRYMEERQRSDRKEREASGEIWEPVYFQKIPDEEGGHIWVYCGDYWEQREQKKNDLTEGVESNFLNGGGSKGLACDFKSYDIDAILEETQA